jgi:hypothetical protein
MKEFTKDIIEVLSQMGIEKIKEAGSVEALVAMIKEQGVEAEPEEVMAAMHELLQQADDKQELDVDAMESVAGGIAPAALIPLIPTVIDGITTVVKKIKGDPKKPESTPAAPATTTAPQGPAVQQTTTNNNQIVNHNNVNGPNTSNNISFA